MYRMASSVLILGFFFLSIIALSFNFPTWVLILLSLVNDFTAMATSKDSVRAAPAPLRPPLAPVRAGPCAGRVHRAGARVWRGRAGRRGCVGDHLRSFHEFAS